MCLIIWDPEARFDIKLIPQIRVHNGDGVGYMWVENGRVHAKKGLWDNAQARKEWLKIDGKPLVAHFRSITKGYLSVDNCQPFKILDLEENGRDLYMMHNGTLPSTPIDDQSKSDSWHYAKKYISPLLKANPGLIDQEEFKKFLSSSIGQNRLVFLDNEQKVVIVNEEQGKKLDNNCWVSNQYSLKPKKYQEFNYNRSGKWNSVTRQWESDSPVKSYDMDICC